MHNRRHRVLSPRNELFEIDVACAEQWRCRTFGSPEFNFDGVPFEVADECLVDLHFKRHAMPEVVAEALSDLGMIRIMVVEVDRQERHEVLDVANLAFGLLANG